MNAATTLIRVRAGRPTPEQAETRKRELLERALYHFLAKGFDQTTIEAVAADVGMTKRTVYARYPEKTALFLAAVRCAVERMIVPLHELEALDRGNIAQTLAAVARMRLDQVMTPQGLQLQRIINTESYRFPEIFTLHYELGARPVIDFLAALLARETAAGRLAIAKPAMAANVFMSMVVSGPVRIIVSGNRISKAEIEERMSFAIRLFLDGARPR